MMIIAAVIILLIGRMTIDISIRVHLSEAQPMISISGRVVQIAQNRLEVDVLLRARSGS